MKKRFIEWDLPLKEISEASAREKKIRHGHPSTLYVWWARKPLASSRATNFASLIDLPADKAKRKEITKLIKKIIPWEAIKNGNNEDIKKAQQMIKEQWGDIPPKVLDPFAGGGSIPLEAIRLGCETYANDYNPAAVFIEKATLEWPQKFGIPIPHPKKKVGIDGETQKINLLPYMIERWANIILNQVKEEIAHFYPPESDGSIPVGYIWARTIPCQNPNCQFEIPLINQFWLSKKENKKIAYKPIIDKKNKTINFKILEGQDIDFNPSEGTIRGGNVRCLGCEQTISSSEIRRLAMEGRMKERMVIAITKHPDISGKSYRTINPTDISIFNSVKTFLEEKTNNWPYLDSPVPDERIRTPDGREIIDSNGAFFVHLQPVLYGMARFGDLFNTRQKLALMIFVEKIIKSHKLIKKDLIDIGAKNYGIDIEKASDAIIGYIALSLGKTTMKCNNLARWNPTAEKTEGPIANNSISMLWNFSEINPLSDTAGSWNSYINYTISAIEPIQNQTCEIFISNHSATFLPFPDNYFDAVLTDPPYYDNVPYGDLSDFFYVWLKRIVGNKFPDLFSTPLTPKTEECIENESLLRRATYIKKEDYRNFSIKNKEGFNQLLTDSFKEIYRVLKPDGITTIVYAHKTTAGWETMLNSLINAGLVVTASWPIHTEMKGRLRAVASAALVSSIYMVCRKTEREKVGFYSEIQPLIKQRVEEKLQQFWNEGIAGGDFFISAIGPAMEIFSMYERVEKLSGEPVTTAELLDYIRSVSTDFIVNKLLKDASSAKIDNESEFYLAYRWTYLDNTVEYDDARKLASASGFSLEDNWGPNGFIKKSGSKISVLGPKERDEIDKTKNMVDVMHKCLLLWEQGEKEEITELLAKTGYADSPAFKQFCQAVAESLLNGNKEKQLLEGFLIGIDSYARAIPKVDKSQADLKQFGVR